MPIPNELKFKVSFPTDDGFLGRECNNPECMKYFKIHTDSMNNEMYCPYCGEKFKKEELWSSGQLDYAREVVKEEALALVQNEIRNMLRNAVSGSKCVTYKEGAPRVKNIPESPKEKDVDSELACPECSSKFQVYGIFGFCPGCRSENILLYDANWEIIKKEILASVNKERSIRHAYSDLVSTFESFCRKKAKLISIEKGRFQNIEHTRQLFKERLKIDLFQDLEQKDIRKIKRVFEKRNIAEHNAGIISKRYVEQIPEDVGLLGQKAELSIDELESASKILKVMLDKFMQIEK